MNVAFITVLNLDDLSDLPGVATEINDDLTQSGFEVISVQPWARPSTAPTTAVPTQPITITPTQNPNPNPIT
jgi:hypothetical protein